MSALFAATHADRTQALIMYGSYARGSATDDYPWAPEWDQVEAAAQMIDAEWGKGLWLDVYAPSVAADPEFARWWSHYQRVAASPAMAKAVVRLAAEIDIRDVLPAISAPTLVLHRSGDFLWPVEGARFVAESIPGARLVELAGEDHFPFAGDVELASGRGRVISDRDTPCAGARPQAGHRAVHGHRRVNRAARRAGGPALARASRAPRRPDPR